MDRTRRQCCLWGTSLLLAATTIFACDDASLFSGSGSELEEDSVPPSRPQRAEAGAPQSGRLSPDLPIDPGPLRVVEIAAGNYHACARLSDGTLLCWGGNTEGQLGLAEQPDEAPLPSPVVNLSDSTSLQAGEETTCSLNSAGDAHCWGWNFGVGGGNLWEPTKVQDLGAVHQIRLSRTAVCAVMSAGEVNCWGNGAYGQLGNGSELDDYAPMPVIGISNAVDGSGGTHHFCAVLATGEVSCWGWNNDGQLGIDGGDASTPTKIPGMTNGATIAAGYVHTCATLASGELWCWGSNSEGQAAESELKSRVEPHKVAGLVDVKQVVAAESHTCALEGSGDVYCFGWDALGAIGNGGSLSDNEEFETTPAKVLGLDDVVQLAAGAEGLFTCALRGNGEVWCWGDGYSGQLGPDVMDLSFPVAYAPVQITGLPVVDAP